MCAKGPGSFLRERALTATVLRARARARGERHHSEPWMGGGVEKKENVAMSKGEKDVGKDIRRVEVPKTNYVMILARLISAFNF